MAPNLLKIQEKVSGKVEERFPPWTNSLVLFVLFFAGLAVYYPSLHGDFVNMDDLRYIQDNEYIRDLSLRGIYRIFSSVIVANYFPLQTLSYGLDYGLWGLNPFGYHLTNLLLHIGNGYLVFLLFRRLLPAGFWLPLVGSLIFILHPVNVESVAWISERKNVLSTFLFLLSFLCYRRYLGGARKGPAYVASLIFFLFSALAKVSTVVLPFLLILYDMCWTTRPPREWLKDKIPFLAISAFFSWLAVSIYRMQGYLPEYHGGNPLITFLTMIPVVVEYILSLLVPIHLYFYYDTPIVQSFWEFRFLLSLSLFIILWALALRWVRENRPLFFFWLWFMISLLPVLNIVPIAVLRADRYLYLPSIGFSFLLIWGLPKIFDSWTKGFPWVKVGTLAMILGALAFLAEKQNRVWEDSHSLWSHTLQHTSTQAQAYQGLGNAARDQGQTGLATLYYQAALKLKPTDPLVLNNLGDVYLGMGRIQEAQELFQQALSLDPSLIEAQINQGIVFHKMGKDDLAISILERLSKDYRNIAKVKTNLGAIYHKKGDVSRAMTCFQQAIQADPTFVLARTNLAVVLRDQGQLEKAIAQLEKALEIKPHSFRTKYVLGRFYLEKGVYHRAAGTLAEALKEKPHDPEALFFLALAKQHLPGGKESSRACLQKAMIYEKDPAARAEMEKKWRAVEEKLEGKGDLRS